MVNGNLAGIHLEGEKQVELWLVNNAYNNVSKELLHPGVTGLKATGSVEDILIQVRTFQHPHRPFKLSDFEADRLIRRASKMKLVAYAAYVVLDKKNQLVGEINWDRLS